jgi:hypothetical protein
VSPRVAGSDGRWGWGGLVRTGGQGAQAGENHGEEMVAGWQAQDELAGVVDQPARDAQQAVSQGGDHGFAVADAQAGQRLGCWGRARRRIRRGLGRWAWGVGPGGD